VAFDHQFVEVLRLGIVEVPEREVVDDQQLETDEPL
jgi:hypothetical protein